MTRKDSLNNLRTLFLKKKTLNMNQLFKTLNTTSRTTAFRYLKELKHLTSYTHNGKYYTLPEIAQFDQDGFWYYGDIGFSCYGTLMNTLTHVITMSKSGKTNSELEKHFRTRVQNSLQNLLKTNKITAKKGVVQHHLYVHPDPAICDLQIKKRMKVGERKRLPEWIIAEILIETIRSFPMPPQIDAVMKCLSKRGSLINKEQVKQVFEEMELEKKTLD